jgi:RNA polymerase subunit RPABC4/transcription elongation factor Spt4
MCPVCSSKNVAPYMGFRTGFQFECLDCGWFGVLALIDEEEQKQKIKKTFRA